MARGLTRHTKHKPKYPGEIRAKRTERKRNMHVTVMGDSNEQNIVPRADEEIISVDVSGVVRKFPSFSLDVSCPLCSHTQDPFLPHSQESQRRVPTEERDENRFPIRARGYSPPRGEFCLA